MRPDRRNGLLEPLFFLDLNDLELDNVEQLFSKLQGKVANRKEEDRVVFLGCYHTEKDSFRVVWILYRVDAKRFGQLLLHVFFEQF